MLRRSAVCFPLLALALAACAPGDAPGREVEAVRGPAVAAAAGDWDVDVAAPEDTGDFRVAYVPVADPRYRRWQADFRHAGVLEGIARGLNEWIALPADVTLVMAECGGDPNAFYDPETRTITLCFEVIEHLDAVFGSEGATPEEHETMVLDAATFLIYHEVGHALVDLLGVPVTGREEDAVDALATLMLADGSEEGAVAAINGAIGLQDDSAPLDESALAATHSLGPVRLANVLCWVYGQDPQVFGYLVRDGHLPAERAEGCAYEFAQLADSWGRLLEPALKPPPA